MNHINSSSYRYGSAAAAYEKSGVKAQEQSNTEASQKTDLKEVPGRTIGSPKLSEKALKYYEELKKKYSNMDFILISPDKKEEVERNKGMYSSSKELLVLIDSDKIERMAEDEEFRKQYENILDNATSQIQVMKQSLGSNASKVKSFGMTIDDQGLTSFFAVIDKSLELQRERIAENKEDSAKAAKEAARKKSQEKQAEKSKGYQSGKEKSDTVTVTANSWNELLNKIENVIFSEPADSSKTESKNQIGQNIDYAL